MEVIVSFFATNLLILGLLKLVCGDYILRVEIDNYVNPTNQCGIGCNGGCCDNFDSFTCFRDDRCDNEFFFCVRPLEATRPSPTFVANSVGEGSMATRAGNLGCLQPSPAYRSDTYFDANFISAGSSTFLGLPNPLVFPIAAARWEGIQFYADVIDRDSGPRTNDELVDFFPISVRPSDLNSRDMTSRERTYDGLVSSIRLSFQVQCQPGFVGSDCRPAVPDGATTAISNHGVTSEGPTGNSSILNTLDQDTTYYSGGPGPGVSSSNDADTTTGSIKNGSTSGSLVGVVSGAAVIGIAVVLASVAVCLGLLLFIKRRGKKVALSDDIPDHIPTVNNVAYASNGEDAINDVVYDYPEGVGFDISSSIKGIVSEGVQLCTNGNPAYGVLDKDVMKMESEVLTQNNLAYGAF